MSDPLCGGECACPAMRDELERYKRTLEAIKVRTEVLLADEDGGHEQALLEFILSTSEEVKAALDGAKG